MTCITVARRLLNEKTAKVIARLTVDNPLHPPNAKSDDEADGIPGAAGPVGHRGGHHGGQGQHDDSAIKHLSGSDNRSTFLEAIVSKYSNLPDLSPDILNIAATKKYENEALKKYFVVTIQELKRQPCQYRMK